MSNLRVVRSSSKTGANYCFLKFADRLKDFGQLESMPKLEGKRMLAIFTPKTGKKVKSEAKAQA